MAARVVGIRQEGVNPCWMVPSKRDEVHVQLHDITGKVQSAQPSIAALVRKLPRWCCASEKKNEFENKSKPRFRVNRIPWAGVKDPCLGHRMTSS